VANLTSALKEEITRLARKEIKSETEALKKAASLYRSEIAELKRRTVTLEKQLSKIGKEVSRNAPPKVEADPSKIRFVAKGFKSMREKLGITAKEMSVLLDISAPTIYNWEAGISKPKQAQLIRIAHLRTMNKNEVAEVLVQLTTPAPKAKAKVVKTPQLSKATSKATVKPAPKVAVEAKQKAVVAPVKKVPVTIAKKSAKSAAKLPAKNTPKAIVKPAPKAKPNAAAKPVSKVKAPKVIAKPSEPAIQTKPKAVRTPRKPSPVPELAVASVPEPVNVTAPAPIPAPVTEQSSGSQAEV
jgi:DNA-binding transcriptional regulator YiaG